jgi:hypothetical protein
MWCASYAHARDGADQHHFHIEDAISQEVLVHGSHSALPLNTPFHGSHSALPLNTPFSAQ